MKTTRRILSMVLALMMILSLSVTAFATEEVPYIEVKIEGDSTVYTYQAYEGESLYKAVEDTGLAKWDKVKDYYDPNTIHYALTSFMGKGSAGIQNNETDRAKLQEKGYNYDSITWLGDSHPGYGLISSVANGDVTTYTYIYAGYDWTYTSSVNGQIWNYMCCYYVDAEDVITMNYSFNVSVWSTTTPIV